MIVSTLGSLVSFKDCKFATAIEQSNLAITYLRYSFTSEHYSTTCAIFVFQSSSLSVERVVDFTLVIVLHFRSCLVSTVSVEPSYFRPFASGHGKAVDSKLNTNYAQPGDCCSILCK